MKRRTLLTAALGCCAMPRWAAANPAGGRVVIVGGGWGGLSAAHHVRRLAPQLEVTLSSASLNSGRSRYPTGGWSDWPVASGSGTITGARRNTSATASSTAK